MIKGADEQLEEEINGVRLGRILSVQSSPPAKSCVCQAGSSLNPLLLGFLWRLYHVGMVNDKLSFQPLSPARKMGLTVPSL